MCDSFIETDVRQDPNLGEDKGELLAPKKDKNKVCSLLNKAQSNFGSSAAFSCQFCQVLRNQNKSKGFVWQYINVDAMMNMLLTTTSKSKFFEFMNRNMSHLVTCLGCSTPKDLIS